MSGQARTGHILFDFGACIHNIYTLSRSPALRHDITVSVLALLFIFFIFSPRAEAERDVAFTSKIQDIELPEGANMEHALQLNQYFSGDVSGYAFDPLENGSMIGVVMDNSSHEADILTLDPDWFGTVRGRIRALGPEEEVESNIFNITVTPVNDPPAIHGFRKIEAEILVIRVNVTDVDNPAADLDLSLLNEGKNITVSGLDLEWALTMEDVGDHNLTVVVSDGKLSSKAYLNIRVTREDVLGREMAMVFPADVIEMHEDVEVEIPLSVEPPAEEAVYSLVSGPEGMEVVNGTLVWTARNEDVGIHNVTVRAEVDGQVINGTFAVRVLNVNGPPVIEDIDCAPQPGFEGNYTFSVLSRDEDPADELNYRWYLNGELVGAGVGIELHLDPGTHTILVNVTDLAGEGAERGESVEIKEGPGPAEEEQRSLPRVSPETLVAGGSLVALLAVASALGKTEAGRFALLSLFVVPLYSRISKEDALDNFLRGKIYGYIIANPGACYSEIMDALDIRNGTFIHHVKVLEKEGFVKSKRDGRYRRFYPIGARVPIKDPRYLTDVQMDIVDVIMDNPGLSQAEVGRRIGKNRRVVNYHVNLLADTGIVVMKKSGVRTKLYVSKKFTKDLHDNT